MPRSTKYNKVPYTVAGDSFISSAKDLSVQRTTNMVAIPSPNSLTETVALYSFPGLSVFGAATSSQEGDRGIHDRKFFGKGWQVSGTTLYSFDSAGAKTSEGTIAGGDLVSFADNSLKMAIVADGKLYEHDGTSLSQVSLSFTPIQVDEINDQFIILDDNKQVWFSDVGVLSFSATNRLSQASLPSNVNSIKVYNQFLFIMGDDIDPWENTGVGNPPFERANGAIIENVGPLSKDTICDTSKALYMLNKDKIPVRVQSFQSQSLTDQNPGIAEIFSEYGTLGAFCTSFKVYGQDIIAYAFPFNDAFWCFSEVTGLWFELEHDSDKQMFRGNTFSYLFDKWLCGDRASGDILELDNDTYQYSGDVIRRRRRFRPLAGETIGDPRGKLRGKLMQFSVESGIGEGDDNPQMMVSFSFDAGRSFGNERWVNLGEEGDYLETVETSMRQNFKDLVCDVAYTGNTRFSMYNADLYLRGGGK